MTRRNLLQYVFIILSAKVIHHTTTDLDKHPELGNHFEGDIILTEERNALTLKTFLWPNGVVPYAFHSNYTDEEKEKVLTAMEGIQDKTCVKFVPHKSETEYIEFGKVPNMGCAAMVGLRPGRGAPMVVNYQAPECLQEAGTIQHELLHVLGLFHEQTRTDRDEYSLMHYPKTAFSKNGKNTIIAKDDPSLKLGQYEGPTEGDLEKVRRLYNCKSSESKTSKSGIFKRLFTNTKKDKQ
ncbi:Low choriolytic enzyme [Blattella germanica]|nr:Low choriolytic enzyme [Blattella germanica]